MSEHNNPLIISQISSSGGVGIDGEKDVDDDSVLDDEDSVSVVSLDEVASVDFVVIAVVVVFGDAS